MIMLIDVRTKEEYNLEHHDNAINIPVNDIEVSPIEAKPSEELVLYCRSGMRARLAEKLLKDRGFKKVSLYNGTGTY